MKKYPYYIQEEKNDCGVACVKMILNYYHGDYDYQKLKEQLKLDNTGVSAYHITHFLNHFGFYSEGISYTWEKFIKTDKVYPIIALVKNEELQNHYIVIYSCSIKKEKLRIGDPKEGIRVISLMHFHQIFTGTVIEIVPTGIISNESDKSFKNIVNHFFYANRRNLILFFLMICFLLFFEFITSFATKYFVNGISKEKNEAYFYIIFFIFFIVRTFRNLFSYYSKRFFMYLKFKLQLLLEVHLYQGLFHMSQDNLNRGHPSFYLQKKDELEVWVREFFTVIEFFTLDFTTFLLLFIVLTIFYPNMFFCFFLFFLFTFLYYFLLAKKLMEREKVLREKLNLIHLSFLETIENIHFIIGAKLQKYFQKKYQQKMLSFFHNTKLFFTNLETIQCIYEIIFGLFELYLLLSFSLSVKSNHLSFANFIFIQTLLSYLFPIVKEGAMIYFHISKIKFYGTRLSSFFHINDELSLFQKFAFQLLECKNFQFTYHEKKVLLKNIDVMIQKGEKILITGKSGSGKSTFLKAISRRLEIDKNQIWMNQLDLCDWKMEEIQYQMPLITQEEQLFQGTLFENITLGRTVPKEELVKILKCTKVDEIMRNHPLGLKQIITNHGKCLSGGERARIILARTLVQPFQVLLIDEGFREMDIQLERQIMKNLFYFYFQKTIIVVSHRMDNKDLFGRHIEFADSKICLDRKL